jgi:hypothetical protein
MLQCIESYWQTMLNVEQLETKHMWMNTFMFKHDLSHNTKNDVTYGMSW